MLRNLASVQCSVHCCESDIPYYELKVTLNYSHINWHLVCENPSFFNFRDLI